MPLEDRELRTSGSVPPPPAGSLDMGSAAVAVLPEDALILIPTRNLVLFPGTVLPITLGRQRSVLAAQTAMRLNRTVGLVLQRDPGIDDPIAVDLHRMGTEASLYVDRGRFEIVPERGKKVEAVKEIAATQPDYPGADFYDKPDGELLHLTNWVESVRSRKPPTAPAEAGVSGAAAAHLANLALRGNGVAVWKG